MRLIYDRDKQLRWRWELEPIRLEYVQANPPTPPDPYRPFEDDAVQAEIRRMAEAEDVLHVFWPKVQAGRTEHLKEAQTPRDDALMERTVADQTVRTAEVDLALDPDNAEFKEKLELAQAELEKRQTALDEAETALSDAVESFDMAKAFTDLVNERPGFAVVEVPGPKNADGLRDLPVLGEWTDSWAATSMRNVGELSTGVRRAANGAFFF